MQIGHKMTELEAFEVLSVVLEHPVYVIKNVRFQLEYFSQAAIPI